MKTKQKLGQFFTTNVSYILQGFEPLIKNKDIIDPYAGGGDLLNWAIKNAAKSVKGYDIDPKFIKNNITINDSLKSIPINTRFNLTNPPYFAKNKMSKDDKNKYLSDNIDDFYLLAIKKIIESQCNEGIIIIPVNFFSAENSNSIRKEFLDQYNITNINYFQEQVFDDTTYNVVAFHYVKSNLPKRSLNFTFFPSKKTRSFDVDGAHSYRIGGKELYDITITKNSLGIKRLTEQDMLNNVGNFTIDGYYNDYKTIKTYNINSDFKSKIDNNIIVLECIDGKAENAKLGAVDIAFMHKKCLVGKNTSRNIAYIMFDNIPLSMQRKLIKSFNQTLNELREKYNSLFLTNFRDGDRKRISFDFCYKLLNYCYLKEKGGE